MPGRRLDGYYTLSLLNNKHKRITCDWKLVAYAQKRATELQKSMPPTLNANASRLAADRFA